MTSLVVALWLACGAAQPPAPVPTLSLKDDNLPLEQLAPERVSDRQVQVVSLTGKWNQPPAIGATHYINFYFPNGYHYAHAVNRGEFEEYFYRGDVRAMLTDYQLKRGCAYPMGQVTIGVSHGWQAKHLGSPYLISDTVTLQLPLYRPVRQGVPASAPPPGPLTPPIIPPPTGGGPVQ